MRPRINAIWTVPNKELKKIVAKENSLSAIIKHFSSNISSANYRALKRRLKEEKIDFSHISLGINSNKGRKFPSKAIPLSEVMIKNFTYSRSTLKKRLIKDGILKNKCAICGLKSIWQNKKIVMVLDHINGEGDDHRRKNLRLLCPNCNSQTPTFSGRHRKKRYHCEECGGETKYKHGKLCNKCSGIKRRIVKNRPSQEHLLTEIEQTSYCAVGRKYGVSDNSVRKWLK